MKFSSFLQFCGLKSGSKKKVSGKEKQVHGENSAQSLQASEQLNPDELTLPGEITESVIEVSTVEQGNERIEQPEQFKQFDCVEDFPDHHYAKKSPGKTNKGWAKRIQEEWKLLESDLPASIYVRVCEQRIDLLRAAIVGAVGTPYHGGLYFFDIRFPSDYPFSPPKVHYWSAGLRINPNLYDNGKVCLSLLNTWWGKGCERWSSSSSTLLQVLVSIEGLVLNEKPYFNEPSESGLVNTTRGEQNSLAYNDKVFILSCKTMLFLLRNPPKHFEDLVSHHFAENGGSILAACDLYASGARVGTYTKEGNTAYFFGCSSAELKAGLEKLQPQLAAAFARLESPAPSA